MSVRSDRTKDATQEAVAALGEQAADVALAEGSSYTVASPDKPLKRQLVVSIRASLDDLCRSRSKSVWSPSSEALKSIFQQKKFTTLAGAAEAQGDLKSVVLHDLSVTGVSSTFPICKLPPALHTLAAPGRLLFTSPATRSARRAHHGRRRPDLLLHGRGLLHDRAARDVELQRARAPAGRRLAGVFVRPEVPRL